jgi:thiol-disulfide isomerase/thioredoxin
MDMYGFSLPPDRERAVPSDMWARVFSSTMTRKLPGIRKLPGHGKGLLLGVALLVIVALAACGSDSAKPDVGSTPESQPTPTAATEDTGPTSGLDPAPDFRFTLYQGQEDLGAGDLSFSDLRGKAVVLNFWAGLCPPCRAEMPHFQEFYNEYSDRVTLFGLDVGPFTGLGSSQNAQDLLKELNITYPAGFTSDEKVIRDYEVLGMPVTVFITADGEIFRHWSGVLSKDKLEEITDDMLALGKT